MDFLRNAIVEIGLWIEGLLINAGLAEPAADVIMTVVGAFVVGFTPLMIVVFLIWMYRKVSARIGGRMGPNSSGTWAGPWGLVQPIADVIKMFTKEDIRPQGIDVIPYNLAPIIIVVAAVMIWAVMPFGPGAEMVGADLNIGIFYVLAFSSAALIAFLMAGWSSNNKYAVVGAFRAVAQLLGYEIPQLLSILIVVMVVSSFVGPQGNPLSLQSIVEAQEGMIFLVVLPLPALVFWLASLAEINARPFELLEAESELVAGVQIEYSAMKWGMFYVGEFMGSVAVSALFATIFLGGWRGPWVDTAPVLGTVWFLLKILFMLNVWTFFQMTLPRLRIDQMLAFNWKFLVPLSLFAICVIGVVNKLIPEGATSWLRSGILLATNVVILLLAWAVLAIGKRRRELRAPAGAGVEVGA
ncbi:MAG: NADH-quinone oxidoreductase subunit H [Anaerolineae bacterium]|nr:NADH-quinone oxidoreductase subunit H [Anaerolineae bacterium]